MADLTAGVASAGKPEAAEKRGRREWNADLYDSKHAFVWQLSAGVFELLDPKPGERVLDLGCGTGHLTARIAAVGAHVLGIDSSPAMIEGARKSYPGIEFEVKDARTFRFDAPFDAVFSNAALHWIKEPEQVVDRVSQALRPGGRFVAEMGGKGNVEKLVRAFNAALDDLGRRPGDKPEPWYFPGIAEYSSILERRGLEVVSAALIDRPTKLDEGEKGLGLWIRMFAGAYVSALPEGSENAFIENTSRRLRPQLFHDGSWYVDYRRLRIIAKKLA